MQSKALKFAITASLTAGLMACGGGGNSASSVSAEGIWGDDTTALIVLEDGEAWGVYGNTSGSNAVAGVLQGELTTSGSAVSGNLRDVSLLGAMPSTVSISGTTVPHNRLNLLLGGTTQLNMTYDASYDTPASLATLQGTYSGMAMGPNGMDDSAIVVMRTNGTISTRSGGSADCTGEGSVTVHNSGKAILDISITFSGTECLLTPGTPITGVAQVIDGTLVLIGLDGGKTQGLLMMGDKTAS